MRLGTSRAAGSLLLLPKERVNLARLLKKESEEEKFPHTIDTPGATASRERDKG